MHELGEEVPVTAARNKVGALAMAAHQSGRTSVLTMNGFPVAAIVPIEVAQRGQLPADDAPGGD